MEFGILVLSYILFYTFLKMKAVEEVNSSMVYLIHCKNLCDYFNVPPPSTTITYIYIYIYIYKERERDRQTDRQRQRQRQSKSWLPNKAGQSRVVRRSGALKHEDQETNPESLFSIP
jgi:hypothetical protein